jgi:hypothetical protein
VSKQLLEGDLFLRRDTTEGTRPIVGEGTRPIVGVLLSALLILVCGTLHVVQAPCSRMLHVVLPHVARGHVVLPNRLVARGLGTVLPHVARGAPELGSLLGNILPSR